MSSLKVTVAADRSGMVTAVSVIAYLDIMEMSWAASIQLRYVNRISIV